MLVVSAGDVTGAPAVAAAELAAELGGRLRVPVEHATARTHAEVPAILHRLDAAAVTRSPGSRDGHPSTRHLLELLACAIPVVATDVDGVGELLEHGRAGSVVAPGDAAAFAAALRTVATRPAIARRLARRARTLAVTRHTSVRAVQRALAVVTDDATGRRPVVA